MLNVFGTFLQGLSHEEVGSECQDYCEYRYFQTGGRRNQREYVIAAVADGVGACSYSQYGSKTAVETSIDYVCEHIGEINDTSKTRDTDMLAIIKESFNAALDAIEKLADEMSVISLSFCTTLTLAVYDGTNLWFGHSGDSGLVALTNDSQCVMLTKRQKGEAVNEVIPLQAGEDEWMFSYSEKGIAAFALLTDGLLDFTVENETYGNLVYYPFYDQLFAATRKPRETDERLVKDLHDYLSGSAIRCRDRVTDDMALVIVSNDQAVPNARITDWSDDKWKKYQEEKLKKIRDGLEAASALQASTHYDSTSQARRRRFSESRRGQLGRSKDTQYGYDQRDSELIPDTDQYYEEEKPYDAFRDPKDYSREDETFYHQHTQANREGQYHPIGDTQQRTVHDGKSKQQKPTQEWRSEPDRSAHANQTEHKRTQNEGQVGQPSFKQKAQREQRPPVKGAHIDQRGQNVVVVKGGSSRRGFLHRMVDIFCDATDDISDAVSDVRTNNRNSGRRGYDGSNNDES